MANDQLSEQQILNAIYDVATKLVSVGLGLQIAGEDTNADVLKVEQQFSYANYTTSAANAPKSGPGLFHGVHVNSTALLSAMTIYDNTAASGTIIATLPANTSAGFYQFNAKFGTGLIVNTAAATDDVTALWR